MFHHLKGKRLTATSHCLLFTVAHNVQPGTKIVVTMRGKCPVFNWPTYEREVSPEIRENLPNSRESSGNIFYRLADGCKPTVLYMSYTESFRHNKQRACLLLLHNFTP